MRSFVHDTGNCAGSFYTCAVAFCSFSADSIRFTDPEVDREFYRLQREVTVLSEESGELTGPSYAAIAAAENETVGSKKWIRARDLVKEIHTRRARPKIYTARWQIWSLSLVRT